MASLTIRNLDDAIKTRLRVRAAENGRSMEEEARVLLGDALRPGSAAHPLLEIHRRFAEIGGVDLPDPPRGPGRPLPFIDE